MKAKAIEIIYHIASVFRFSMAWVLLFIENLNSVVLLNIIYLLSILLLIVTLKGQAVNNRGNPKKRNRAIVMANSLLKTQPATSVVDLVNEKENKVALFCKITKKTKRGITIMLEKLKRFTVAQWCSLILSVGLIALGIMSQYIPQLAGVSNNITAILSGLGATQLLGTFSLGKELGLKAKHSQAITELKKAKQEIQKEIEGNLNIEFADVLKKCERAKKYGGEVSLEVRNEKVQYDKAKLNLTNQIVNIDKQIELHQTEIKNLKAKK